MWPRRETAGMPWPATVGRSKGSRKVLAQPGRSPMLKHDAAPELERCRAVPRTGARSGARGLLWTKECVVTLDAKEESATGGVERKNESRLGGVAGRLRGRAGQRQCRASSPAPPPLPARRRRRERSRRPPNERRKPRPYSARDYSGVVYGGDSHEFEAPLLNFGLRPPTNVQLNYPEQPVPIPRLLLYLPRGLLGVCLRQGGSTGQVGLR